MAVSSLLLLGCLSSVSDPLSGSWEATNFAFTQVITFNGDGSGNVKNSLTQAAFEYEIIDDSHIRYKEINTGLNSSDEWQIRDYQLVNSNTLIFSTVTYIRK